MTEIKNYAVRINGGPHGAGNGVRAQIHLFDAHSKLTGIIDFYALGMEIPADQHGEILRFSLPASSLHDVVDLLRNEKPIFLGWQDFLGNAFLSTTQEPVGEGE